MITCYPLSWVGESEFGIKTAIVYGFVFLNAADSFITRIRVIGSKMYIFAYFDSVILVSVMEICAESFLFYTISVLLRMHNSVWITINAH